VGGKGAYLLEKEEVEEAPRIFELVMTTSSVASLWRAVVEGAGQMAAMV